MQPRGGAGALARRALREAAWTLAARISQTIRRLGRVRRATVTTAALAVLAVNAVVALFAMYVATGRDTVFTGALVALQLVLAFVAFGVAWPGQTSAIRSPFPERTWLLILTALAFDVLWWALVSGVGEVL